MSDKNKLNTNNPKSSLADIILVIAKHLKLILMLTIIAVVLTVIYVKQTYVPKYISSCKMFINEEGGGRTDLSKLASQFGLATQGTGGIDISSSSLYPDIVSSRTFAEIMLDKEFHTEKYNKKLPLIAIFTYGDKPVPSNIDTLKMTSANRIPNMVEFNMQMGFFIIEVTSDEPRFSRDFADTLISELDKLQRKFKKQNVGEKVEYLDQKIALAKIDLEYNEEKLKLFRERNRNVDNSPSLQLTGERLQRDVEIQKGIFLTLKQQLELAKIEEVQKSSFVQILDYPSLPLRVSNPIKITTFIIGGFIGFFFAIAISFIIEYFTIRNKNEATKLSDAKKLAFESIKTVFTFNWLKKKK